jgi:C4-dicarboxylate-specific signal transduction histidine kinase
MCGRNSVCERNVERDAMEQMSAALHTLCQPLTTLQCRLEMAEIIGTADAYREAVTSGLAECERMADGVGSMREIMRASREAAALARNTE